MVLCSFRKGEQHVPKPSYMRICLYRFTVNLPTKSAYTMAYRRAVTLFPTGKCVFHKLIPPFQKSPNVLNQTVRFQNHCGRTTRTFHTGTPSLVAKLLSLDELFARRSLQEYLKKMETEYSECLRAVNTSATEEQCSQDEMRTKRSKVSQLAPLIQSIRELDTKHKEITETEMLLKGETALLLPQKDNK